MEIVQSKMQHGVLIGTCRSVSEVQELAMSHQVLAYQSAHMPYTPIMSSIVCHVGLRQQTESSLLETLDAQLDRHDEYQLSSEKEKGRSVQM